MYQREVDIKLLNTEVLTTFNKYEKDVFIEGLLRYSEGSLCDIQEVIKVSEYAKSKGVNVGDKVKINLANFTIAIPKHNYDNAIQRTQAPEGRDMIFEQRIPSVTLKDKKYALIDYSDIVYSITETEDIEEGEAPQIITPVTKLYV